MISFLRRIYHILADYPQKYFFTIILVLSIFRALFQFLAIAALYPITLLAQGRLEVLTDKGVVKTLFSTLGIDTANLGIVCIIFFIVIQILNAFFSLLTESFVAYANAKIGVWLRLKLLQTILQKSYAYFLSKQSAVFLKKITHDCTVFIDQVLFYLLLIGAVMITFFCYIGMLIMLNWQLAVMFFSGGLLYYLIFYKFLRKYRVKISEFLKYFYRQQSQVALELLQGIKLMRVTNKEKMYQQVFSQEFKKFVRMIPLNHIFSISPKLIIDLIVMLGVGASAYYLLGEKTDKNNLASLLLFGIASMRLFAVFQQIYGSIIQVQTYMFSLEEIEEEFQQVNNTLFIEKDSSHLPDVKFEQQITLSQISYQYPAAKQPILKDFNLTISKGQKIGLHGPSGSGKSTLMDLLLGVINPNKGEVLVDGKNLINFNRQSWFQKVGYVGQNVFIIDGNFAQNIALEFDDNKIDLTRLNAAIDGAQIRELIEKKPAKLQTILGENGIMLSGGERQRVSIARALYLKPEILLLDEATSALDNQTEKLIMAAVYRLPSDITIIMIAHRLSTLEGCDRVLELTPLAQNE